MAHHILGKLNWEREGKEGHPMVFVHPNPTDHNCWLYQQARFSFWFRCIGIDLPGYGKSPKAEAGLTMEDVAQACWEAVNEVTTDPVVLVGLSVGVAVIQHMACQQPERTLALIVTGSGHYEGVKPFAAKRAASYETEGVSFRREHYHGVLSEAFWQTELAQYFADLFMERNGRADAFTIAEQFRALGRPDPDWLTEKIQAPTLIISGTEDTAHQAAFVLHDRIKGSEMKIMQGAGHACNMERPWEWDTYAMEFLRRLNLMPEPAPTGR